MMKLKKAMLLLLICILLTGCWDKIEIDQKGFISVVGVDAGEQIGKQNELKSLNPSDPYTALDIKKLKVTLGAPDISQLGPGKPASAKDIYITTDAYSMQDAISKAALKSSRDIKFSHMKLLVLSKDLMDYPEVVKEIVDYLQREPALNKMMYVVVSNGKAENYMRFKPSMEKNIESYITGIIENPTGNAAVLPVTLNEFLVLLSQNGNAMVPTLQIEPDQNDLKISGVSLIKNYKLNGQLTPIETSNLEMLRGKLKGGRKVIYRKGHPIDITIDSADRKISMDNIGDKLMFNIKVNLEGQLRDYYIGDIVFSKDVLDDLQKNLNKSVEQECKEVIKLTQQEFDVDPIGLREYVEKFHPSIWSRVKGKWDEVYKNADVKVEVNSNIRRIGVTK